MANEAQIRLWNGCAGTGWIQAQALLDRLFLPFEELQVESLPDRPRRILDIGCGTGATTLALARTQDRTRCLGVDVSEPMIALARTRAAREQSNAEFLVADAQEHEFGEGEFDTVVSRFGVMFFDDPLRAFANLRHATSNGGKLSCITFREAVENPFMTAAERAAAPLLPALPPRQPGAPGQFAFANADRVHRILESAGWTSVQHRILDVPCTMPASALTSYLTRLGPVGQLLRDADQNQRQEMTRVVGRAFEPWIQGDEVRFTAACWMLEATA